MNEPLSNPSVRRSKADATKKYLRSSISFEEAIVKNVSDVGKVPTV
jgi:hypothetical protein